VLERSLEIAEVLQGGKEMTNTGSWFTHILEKGSGKFISCRNVRNGQFMQVYDRQFLAVAPVLDKRKKLTSLKLSVRTT